MKNITFGLSLALLATSFNACSSVYFSALEKIGIEKRSLMVSRIKDARESQTEAKEHFKDALEKYRSIIKVDGGSLETKYEKLSNILEESEEKSKEVKSRVIDVREVATALFNEWKDELSEYSDERLRADSEKKYHKAKLEYSKLIGSMKIASEKLDPALKPLRDNVLYLKHNLNAKAISSLDGELKSIESKVAILIEELDTAIRDADIYIKNIEES